MEPLRHSHPVEVRPSGIHGRGAFAAADIPAGQWLELPVLTFPKDPTNRRLRDYVFPWEGDRLKCVCAGWGSFLNSSRDPNVKILSIDKKNLTMTFATTRDVKGGEELTLDYMDSLDWIDQAK